MKDKLWINRWDDRRKNSARQKGNNGNTFITNYTFDDFRKVFIELIQGLNMVQGSQSSYYLTFIPTNNQEVIKIRISDHPSNEQEWVEKEVTGLPNRRYSIVLFSNRSMSQQSSEGVKETSWKSYLSQNIPVYEKCFNRFFLNETYDELKSIISMIFKGECPEDNTLQININENINNMNTNKKTVRLTESKLKSIVAESVKRVLSEAVWYGDIKPFETIVYACQQIKEKFSHVNEPNYEDMSDDSSNMEYRIYDWADRTENDAMDYINHNSQNTPIGGGF